MIAAVKPLSLGLARPPAPSARPPPSFRALLVLFLHNRYRTLGGEEQAVADLAWLVREHLGEPTGLLERDSVTLGAATAARGLLQGGLAPAAVARAVRRSGARVVHAHNTNPSFGPRALRAARAAGARVVLHLHNYRLVCAVGTCVTPRGDDCTRCQGRDTRPGVRLGCRGPRAEAAVYAAGIALHAHALVAAADAVIVPSEAARERLAALSAPLGDVPVHVVGHVVRGIDTAAPSPPRVDGPALLVARLAPEKAIEQAIDACRTAGVPLVIAGDGPERARLEAHATGADVRFTGRVDAHALHALRAEASVALVTSRAHETFGLAALEAMAAGLPTVVSAAGALAGLAPGAVPVPIGDVRGLAAALLRVRGDAEAGRRAHATALRLAAPAAVAPRLAAVYDGPPRRDA
jgi:glycosyltransferase involved in cell wall biosynthesis